MNPVRDLNCSCEFSQRHCPVHRVTFLRDPIGRALRVPVQAAVYEWSSRDKSTLISREREALRLLGEFTGGRYDIGMLAGPASVKRRQKIMSVLDGVSVPQKSAGISILTQRFIVMAGVGIESCPARRDDAFMEWAKI